MFPVKPENVKNQIEPFSEFEFTVNGKDIVLKFEQVSSELKKNWEEKEAKKAEEAKR